MKRIATLLISSVISSVVHAEEVSGRDLEMRGKLYERMSAHVFGVYCNIQHTNLPREEKETWMKQAAGTAFYYYFTTRVGEIPKSTQVEGAIGYLYEIAVKSQMKECFSDPLFRMKMDEPWRSGVPGFSEISQDEYKKHVKKYHVFLDDILKKRRKQLEETRKQVNE